MALAIGYDLKQVHSTSKNVLTRVRYPGSYTRSSTWQPPTFRTASSKAEEPIIPDPALFQSLSEVRKPSGSSSLPSVPECATHLELLQAFYILRRKVLQSTTLDAAFDIKPQHRIVWTGYRGNRQQKKLNDTTFAQRRQVKWPTFVQFAVERCLHWLKIVDSALGNASAASSMTEVLPPLDVLMVWHSFLLNPKFFHRYCETHDLKNIRQLDFPWAMIHRAIEQKDWSFDTPESAQAHLKNVANLESDLLEYLAKTDRSQIIRDVYLRHSSLKRLDVLGSVFGNATKPKLGEDGFLRYCLGGDVNEIDTFKEVAAAVQRQCTFIDKMEKQLWIRSPALEGTLQRAIDRYSKFLKLLKLYPKTMLVPTLDIDLIWHTHQCSAVRYQTDTQAFCGRFIDHDDTVGKPELGDGMEKTQKLFRIRFGREYLICNCWDCELVESELARRGYDDVTDEERDAIARRVAVSVAFHRAVEMARRANESLPVKPLELL